MLPTSCALVSLLYGSWTSQKQIQGKAGKIHVQKASSDKEHYKGSHSTSTQGECRRSADSLSAIWIRQCRQVSGSKERTTIVLLLVGLTGNFSTFKKNRLQMRRSVTCGPSRSGRFRRPTAGSQVIPLLKNRIEIPKKVDSELLLHNTLLWGKIFDEQIRKLLTFCIHGFHCEATTDVKVHAKKMEEYFEHFAHENARMLSVIVHDNLDGNTLCRPCRRFKSLQRIYISLSKSWPEEPYRFSSSLRPRKMSTNTWSTGYQDWHRRSSAALYHG